MISKRLSDLRLLWSDVCSSKTPLSFLTYETTTRMKFFRSLSVSLSLSRALKKSSKNAQKDGKKSSLNFLSLSLFSALSLLCCSSWNAQVFYAREFYFRNCFSLFFSAKNSPFLVEKDARFEGFWMKMLWSLFSLFLWRRELWERGGTLVTPLTSRREKLSLVERTSRVVGSFL